MRALPVPIALRAWRHRLMAVLPLLLGPLAACSISRRQEIAMGHDYARQVDAALPVVQDSAVLGALAAFALPLAQAADRRGLPWRFGLVNVAEVNAFALPGGPVYVTRGLVERTRTFDAFAGVLAHEISHVTRRHAVRQLEALQRANVGLTLACAVSGACEATATRVGIEVGGAALFARYSRDDEREADDDGVHLVVRAGIDPRGIPRLLQQLLDERRERPAGIAAWFRTHPYEEDRIRATRATIATIPVARLAALVADTPAFQAFRARVLALPAPHR